MEPRWICIVLIACLMSIARVGTCTAQDVDGAALANKIDQIFARWNSIETPGYEVGVIQDGKLIFAKGYGMENLEYGVPITPQSRFYIGSMSKQFTAAAVALLAQQGKLQLGDDVRKYVPELPDYGHTITISDLVHHTSGLRDWTSLHLFAGLDPRFEDRLDNDDVLRLICFQRSLNFVPGTDFRYSSSGYILLAKIVERVSGQTLPKFAKRNIFDPLGMTHTIIDDNYARILPHRVESYRSEGDHHYERFLKHFNIYGDGGVITTLEDLSLWDANFYHNRLGKADFANLLLTRGRLNSGQQINYAFGLELDTHNGYRVVKHNGAMLGFDVDMIRFPDQRLTIIVLGNSRDGWSTGLALAVADRLLPSPPTSRAPIAAAVKPAVQLTTESLKQFEGAYAVRDLNSRRVIVLKDGQLTINETQERLSPVSSSKFIVLRADGTPTDPPSYISFEPAQAGGMFMHFSSGAPLGSFDADRYDPTLPSSLADLKPLVGRYESDELQITYTFGLADGEFFLQMGDSKPTNLFPKHDDPRVEWNSKNKVWIGFGMVAFVRGKDGRVIGLEIGDAWVKGVHFRRL
jgi:CubicO group peptidase (beta-lactamase class C family)